MKSPARVLLAGVAAFGDRRRARRLLGRRRRGDSGKTELRVATFPPGADAAAYDGVRRAGGAVRGREPRHRHHRRRVRVGGPDVRRAARRRQPARRLHRAVHRRQDAARERPAHGRHRRDGRARLRRQLQPDHPRRRHRRRRPHLRLPAPGLRAWACTTTATLFEAAGLDPDSPPTTWDEVRECAKQIPDATGKAGYAQMAHQQHRRLAARPRPRPPAAAARRSTTPTAPPTSTIDNDGTKAALQFLHDAEAGRTTRSARRSTLDWGTINQEFAAGNIGMYTSGSDIYTALVRDFGLEPRRLRPDRRPDRGRRAGTLGGGDIAVMSPTVDDETKAAGVKWIDWYYMQKLLDEDAAVLDAKTLDEPDQAVGTPVLPVLDRELYEESLTWIEPYINVPRDQMAPFTDAIWDQTPVGEPKEQDAGDLRAPRRRRAGGAHRRERRHRRPPRAGRRPTPRRSSTSRTVGSRSRRSRVPRPRRSAAVSTRALAAPRRNDRRRSDRPTTLTAKPPWRRRPPTSRRRPQHPPADTRRRNAAHAGYRGGGLSNLAVPAADALRVLLLLVVADRAVGRS